MSARARVRIAVDLEHDVGHVAPAEILGERVAVSLDGWVIFAEGGSWIVEGTEIEAAAVTVDDAGPAFAELLARELFGEPNEDDVRRVAAALATLGQA